MLDDKQRAESDQTRATIIELYCPMLFGLYTKLQEEGFSEERAFQLTGTYFSAMIIQTK